MSELIIKETAEILKYGFSPRGRRRKELENIGKLELIKLRDLIGFAEHRSWLSRDWVLPIYNSSGFNVAKFDYRHVIKKCSFEKTVAYFNLLWIQKIPTELTSIIVEYFA
jgi:hypothetical protein